MSKRRPRTHLHARTLSRQRSFRLALLREHEPLIGFPVPMGATYKCGGLSDMEGNFARASLETSVRLGLLCVLPPLPCALRG
ncbi:hypothetical protein BCV70DRAFT_200309 [Testicularia cyperi]|uniref:Uncharacterized protein n=1 Tax=Testicularia cyperi TaxID=1882483 RepID=A0A317XPE3_9BASI|nr:hypothetical protein BCV70DRAFT_200309 [Testicularia cyperi]